MTPRLEFDASTVEATYGAAHPPYDHYKQEAAELHGTLCAAQQKWKSAMEHLATCDPSSSEFDDAVNSAHYAYQTYLNAANNFYLGLSYVSAAERPFEEPKDQR